ncbi:tRNA-modifying protein YgfZ [Buchnera aphidicola]|uniref:tRNA-modifying protein YgfZ n=1 Tax=Buchnera aphidicola TaxID=9 RepID=UPI00346399D5
MSLFLFPKYPVYSSINLPLTLHFLEEWSLVYIEGTDSTKHLQNQFTIDVFSLNKKEYKFCAHCNFNGKVLATMFLFHYRKGYAYIIRKSLVKMQVKQLKKYAIFSKVEIKELDNLYLFGISGSDARLFLSELFIDIPNVNHSIISHEKRTILLFSKPIERFFLILSLKDVLFLKKQKNKIKLFNNSKQWTLLDIEAGFPIFDKKLSQKFLPQSLNLEKLQAISFNKGCYYGQETIARTFYKNLNKYELHVLVGIGKISAEIGSIIETEKEGKWYRIGFLIAMIYVEVNQVFIQAVINKSINAKNIFRIYGLKNIFLIKT